MHEKEAISTASKAAMIERIDTNSTTDHVDPSAVGGDYHDLPNGYYRSPQFLGSFMGVILMALSLYLGFVLPVGPPYPPAGRFVTDSITGQHTSNH